MRRDVIARRLNEVGELINPFIIANPHARVGQIQHLIRVKFPQAKKILSGLSAEELAKKGFFGQKILHAPFLGP